MDRIFRMVQEIACSEVEEEAGIIDSEIVKTLLQMRRDEAVGLSIQPEEAVRMQAVEDQIRRSNGASIFHTAMEKIFECHAKSKEFLLWPSLTLEHRAV